MLARMDEPNVTAENGSMAFMLHLAALTHRLPLRILQVSLPLRCIVLSRLVD